jgi:hypothetical protein
VYVNKVTELAAKEVILHDQDRINDCFNEECKKIVEERNRVRVKIMQREK